MSPHKALRPSPVFRPRLRDVRPSSPAVQLLAFVAAFGLVACGQDTTGTTAATLVPGQGGAGSTAAPSPTEPDVQIEAPMARRDSPDVVMVDFGMPMVGQDRVAPWHWADEEIGETPPPWVADAQLVLDPPTPGRLVWTAPGRMSWQPDSPLRPGSRLGFRIDSVQVDDKRYEPREGAPWAASIQVPTFAAWPPILHDVRPGESVTLDLGFTSTLLSQEAAGLVSVQLGERTLPVEVTPTPDGRGLRLVVQTSDSPLGGTLTVNVKAGAPWNGPGERIEAPAATFEITVPQGPTVRLLGATIAETPTGFTVEVICTDGGHQSGYGRWWHNREAGDWEELSRRCLPTDESAAAAIRIDPPVPFTVGPSSYGFRVSGDFRRGEHRVEFGAGLKTVDGGVLPSTWATALFVPSRSSKVDFAAQGRYLPRDAWAKLPIRHVNAAQARLKIRHVPRRNLLFWLTGEAEGADDRTSDQLVDTAISLPQVLDEERWTNLDLRQYLKETEPGLYEIEVASGASRDVARVAVTDLHLVAKQGVTRPGEPYAREVHAWALHGTDLAPTGGVDLQLLRRSGKSLGACRTGTDGGCVLRLTPDPVDPSPPFAIVATKGEELTFLAFDELRAEVADSVVQGLPYLDDRPYRVAAWTDRGVYRPGDTIHFASVLRGRDDLAPPAGLPVVIIGTDPRGQVAFRSTVETNAAGLVHTDHTLADFAATGRFSVRMEVGGRVVKDHAVSVEEFVPERLEMNLRFNNPSFSRGQSLETTLKARYLFGGSAAGSPVELRCDLSTGPYTPPKNADFHYGPWVSPGAEDDRKPISLGAASGELGQDGTLTLPCPEAPEIAGFTGVGRLEAHAVIFEAGSGRSTHRAASATLSAEPFLLGLKTGTTNAVAGKAIDAKGVIVDLDGAVLSEGGTVEVEAFRLEREYGYWYDEDEGRERWSSHLRRVREGTQTVAVEAGRFSVRVVPTDAGDGMLLRATRGQAITELYVPAQGRWYWDEDVPEEGQDRTPRPQRATALALDVPERVEVGKTATATFVAPFPGRALVSVETHEVVRANWVDVAAGPVRVQFTPPSFVPNLYVSVFLVKDPHAESPQAFLPDRAYGVASVPVEPAAHRLGLTLTVPDEVRPRGPLEIAVQARGHAGDTFVTVAAVDEGILSLTQFETPDPLADLFERRALGVGTFETVGWTLVAPTAPGAGHGGDAGGMPGRVQAIKPVALWSGPVKLDASGRATVPLGVPEYQGQLRIMAVAASAGRAGAAEAKVRVRDPLVVLATAPRFLIGGDRFILPIRLTNGTGAAGVASVVVTGKSVDVGGLLAGPGPDEPLQIEPPKPAQLTLAKDGSGTVFVPVRAARALGAATLTVKARLGQNETTQTLQIPFLPGGPKERLVQRLPMERGELDLKARLTGWVPTTEQSTIWITNNPYAESFDHLEALVRYPYGCIEQTTSSTRPLLYARAILEQVAPELADRGVDPMVAAGIRRLLSMQTTSGGFAYWPGGDHPVTWGSAYAMHLLLEARDLGHAVDADAIDRGLRYLQQVGEAPLIAERAAPYIQYVLAVGGRANKARAERLLAELTGPRAGSTVEDELLLQAALWLAGDRRHEAALRSGSVELSTNVRDNGTTYWSSLRTVALRLHVQEQLFGVEVAQEALAALVDGQLRGRSPSYTTQELAWSVAALGRRVQAAATDYSPAQLLAGGQPVRPQKGADGKGERTWNLMRASEYPDLRLTLSEKGKGALYAIVASEGARVDASWRVGGEGLRVRRRYLDAAGQELGAGARLALGALVQVVVEIENKTGTSLRNVALVDRLPAGWEIENPRLGRDGSTSSVDPEQLWALDHMEVRDDRIEAFGTLDSQSPRVLTYGARAVSAGTFTIPPVEAEAMYEPRIWARESGGVAFVEAAFGEGLGAQ